MTKLRSKPRRAACLGAFCGAMAVVLSGPSAQADLKHRYSFENDASDSVGGADGTVVDAGTTPNAVFSGGQVDLSANTGQGSNGITEDAYIDLPNGVVTGAVNSGAPGAVSFEWWFTVAEQRTWQRIGDFGTSNDGEDTSASGSSSNYLLVTPNSGRRNNGLEMTNHPASDAGEPAAWIDGPFPVGTEQHVLAVFDQNDTTVGANGSMYLYLNGAPVGTGEIHADTTLSTINDNNNWLGRSQWNDPVFDGSFNEFRIYDMAVSPAGAAASYAAGPNTIIPEPVTIAFLCIGAASASLGWRRRRR